MNISNNYNCKNLTIIGGSLSKGRQNPYIKNQTPWCEESVAGLAHAGGYRGFYCDYVRENRGWFSDRAKVAQCFCETASHSTYDRLCQLFEFHPSWNATFAALVVMKCDSECTETTSPRNISNFDTTVMSLFEVLASSSNESNSSGMTDSPETQLNLAETESPSNVSNSNGAVPMKTSGSFLPSAGKLAVGVCAALLSVSVSFV